MARFHPPDPPEGIEGSESRVWEALEQLEADWNVFHSVTWQAARDGHQGDGEADFILLHPRHGILVLEVKGGSITLEGRVWSSTGRRGTNVIKDPFRQATASKHALLRYLRAIPGLTRVPRIGHAVATPDWPMPEDSIGMHPREIVLDAADRADAAAAVERVLDHWEQWEAERIPAGDIEKIVRLLAPTLSARRSLGSAVADAEVDLVRLTRLQKDALRMLRMVRRCIVAGGAGTGKTLLAIERARTLAEEGARTLLLCYNQPLSRHLAGSVRDVPLVVASTFHALCLKMARQVRADLPSRVGDEWFDERAADVLADVAASMEEGERFDALVVDEGQDFCDGWLTAAQLLLRDPDQSPLMVFLDSHQEIFRRSLKLPEDWPRIQLDRNCRNTLQIAELVARCFGDAAPGDGARGPPPSFVEAQDEALPGVARDVVCRLLEEEGLGPEQITVLASSRRHVEKLRSYAVGSSVFVEPGASGVVAETVHRFKGLEAPAIVLCLAGDPGEDVDPRALFYVGASRARSSLVVVATREWQRWISSLR